MEKLAKRIAASAARNGKLDEESQRVIAYGLGALFQILFLLAASLMLGLTFHCLVESMAFLLSAGLMKWSAGGAHSSNSANCVIISLLSIFVISLLARYAIPVFSPYWYVYLGLITLAFGAVFLTVYRHAPVISPYKPVARPEKIRYLRRQSFLTVGVFFAMAILLTHLGKAHPRLINGAISLCLALLWQAFLLTETGAKLISFIDSTDSRAQ